MTYMAHEDLDELQVQVGGVELLQLGIGIRRPGLEGGHLDIC